MRSRNFSCFGFTWWLGTQKGLVRFKLLQHLPALVEHVDEEKRGPLQELHSLVRNVEHIKEIVAMQQTYARVSRVTEIVHPSELAEDALRMHEAAYERHGVKVCREFAEVPRIAVDRHKVIQILVDLLQNPYETFFFGRRPAPTNLWTLWQRTSGLAKRHWNRPLQDSNHMLF